jgi:two-component system, NarL family, nitrate/nitrite response regulator NarL
MVTAGTRLRFLRPAQKADSHQPEAETDEPPLGSTEHEAIPITLVARQRTWSAVNGSSALPLNGHKGDTQCVPTLRNRPRQSEREAQILDGLVRGHANKVIARSSDNTEAAVKVHEIDPTEDPGSEPHAGGWALEHGHSADD